MTNTINDYYADTMAYYYANQTPFMWFNFPDRIEQAPLTWVKTVEYLIENFRAPLLATGYVVDGDSVISELQVLRHIKAVWGFYGLLQTERDEEYFDEVDSGMDILSGVFVSALGIDILPPFIIADSKPQLFTAFQKQSNLLWRG